MRNTLPLAAVVTGGAAALAVALFVVALVTPFRMVPMTVARVVAGAAFFDVTGFLTTVPALPSLVSLVSLGRRPARVVGRGTGALDAAAVAVRRVFAVVVDVELVSDVVVAFLVLLVRVALALSTMLERTLVAAARDAVVDFNGEPGRGICGFVGDSGRSRFARREFDDVGDKIWFGLTSPGSPLVLFFAPSLFSTLFSLSPAISLLMRL